MRWVLVGLLVLACPQAHAEFYTGHQLHGLCRTDMNLVRGYVAGVHDKASRDSDAAAFFIAASKVPKNPALEALLPTIMNYCASDIAIGQLADVVCRSLDKDPGERHRPAATLIVDALAAEFPCRK